MLVEKHRLEKEQNSQLRNQIAQLLQSDQEQKLQMQQQDSTIQDLQVGAPCVLVSTRQSLRSMLWQLSMKFLTSLHMIVI